MIKKWLLGSSLHLILAVISAIISVLLILNQNAPVKYESESEFSSQIETLNGVEKNLVHLINFIHNQKQMITEAHVTLGKLKDEREKIKPLVEADRQVVESLLRIQNEQTKREILTDRIIGFFIGIAASLTASFLYAFAAKRKK